MTEMYCTVECTSKSNNNNNVVIKTLFVKEYHTIIEHFI